MKALGASRRLQCALRQSRCAEVAALLDGFNSHTAAVQEQLPGKRQHQTAAPLGSGSSSAGGSCTRPGAPVPDLPPHLQPAPWPVSRRALHSAGAPQNTAAMPQAVQQQQQQQHEEAPAAGAAPDPRASAALDAASAAAASAATALSGAVAQLSSGDPFLNSIEATEGPIVAYKEGRLHGLYRKDERQELTISRIQRVYEDLVDRLGRRERSLRKGRGLTLVEAGPSSGSGDGGGWFSSWFSRQESTSAGGTAGGGAVQGLYMYGGVGVGKTMLMDLLAKTAPPYFQLERTHFHDFMIDVHQRLRHFSSMPDPLTHVADSIADKISVLCLDELFVTDVADAMILHRLFGRLWERGLVLVATSNRHPDSLYEGGLQRNLFLPFIQRLKERCVVHDMDSRTDYRKLASHHRGLYFVTPTREEDLYERFIELTMGQPVRREYADVAMGRQLELPRTAGCVALFTFEELCNRPLGAADYIAVANAKHTLALSGVPIFTAANRHAAYRFVTLVDVLYEHRIRFLCSAEAMPFELFENVRTQQEARQLAASGSSSSSGSLGGRGSPGAEVVDDNLGFAKDRTISRLTEMQSEEYLRAHAKAHAPELLLAMAQGKGAANSSSSSSSSSSSRGSSRSSSSSSRGNSRARPGTIL